jgi:hypothetical protein
MQPRKLGKLPPRHDRKALPFAAYVRPEGTLPVAPPAQRWSAKVTVPWGVMLNDRLGDCAVAAPAHMVLSWTANARGRPAVIPDSQVLAAYETVGGYRPGDPSTDNGCVMTDVLRYWQGVGIGGHKIVAYLSIEPGDLKSVHEAVYLFGGVCLGLALPASAEQQIGGGRYWHVTSLAGDGRPGSWGGHAVPVVDYDTSGMLTCVTWGAPQRMTPLFLRSYCDECYAVLSEDWLDARGKDPSGFDLAALRSDLAALQ